eukprot:gene10338-8274_t
MIERTGKSFTAKKKEAKETHESPAAQKGPRAVGKKERRHSVVDSEQPVHSLEEDDEFKPWHSCQRPPCAAPVQDDMFTLEDNPLVYESPGFETMAGYSHEDLIGTNCRMLQGPSIAPETVSAFIAGFETHSFFSLEVTNQRKDGSSFQNLLCIKPLIRGKTNAEIAAASAASGASADSLLCIKPVVRGKNNAEPAVASAASAASSETLKGSLWGKTNSDTRGRSNSDIPAASAAAAASADSLKSRMSAASVSHSPASQDLQPPSADGLKSRLSSASGSPSPACPEPQTASAEGLKSSRLSTSAATSADPLQPRMSGAASAAASSSSPKSRFSGASCPSSGPSSRRPSNGDSPLVAKYLGIQCDLDEKRKRGETVDEQWVKKWTDLMKGRWLSLA